MAEKLVVAYWAIRGLGAPLRMMCEYAGADYEAVTYGVTAKEGGGWDVSSWFSVKPPLKERNALMNLPYVIDGDTVVTQSNACMMFLGRKFKLTGKSEAELVKVEQCLCEVFDLRNAAVKLFYSPPEVFENDRDSFLSNTVATSFGKLNGWLEQQGTVYLASDEPTVPDFHFFEMIDQIEALAKKYNKDSPMKEFAAVTKFYESFKNLPAIQKYLASDLHKLPINNKMASFGAE
mmetsp:Transcript_95237/g.142720  ORF Transcript_95237/g.142720 Transcript_95237/m.142720 type:complete len:234 (-) Transcript_95237:27-728(-)